ncbi:hypothetical protein ScPMuIL_008377 [Solemya velum]
MAPNKSRKKRKNQPDEEEGPQPIPVAEEKATASVIAGDEGDEFGEAQTEDDEMLQEGGQDPPAAASDENNVTDGHATCGITKAKEQELAEFFADNEFIYDKSKVDFKNSKKKERKYMEMAEKLGVTVADIRLWYKSQRTILGKMKTAGKKSGQKAIVLIPRQRWVNNNLGFLTKHIVHRSQGCQLGHLSGRITEAASDEEGLDEEGPDASQAPSSNQVSSQGAAPPKKRQKRGSPTDVDKALLEFIRTSTDQTAIRSQVDAALTQGADERQAWLEWAGRPPTPNTPLVRVHQGHFQLGEPGGPPFHHPSISPQHFPDDPATQASVSADRLHPGRSTCFLPWDARTKQHLVHFQQQHPHFQQKQQAPFQQQQQGGSSSANTSIITQLNLSDEEDEQ